MIEIQKLPADYRHPQGWDMGGYWGAFENGRLIVAEPTLGELERIFEGVRYELNQVN